MENSFFIFNFLNKRVLRVGNQPIGETIHIILHNVYNILDEGNATRIIVENEQGKTLLEIPVTIGLVGALLAPWLAALGAIAAIATKCKIRVEKEGLVLIGKILRADFNLCILSSVAAGCP